MVTEGVPGLKCRDIEGRKSVRETILWIWWCQKGEGSEVVNREKSVERRWRSLGSEVEEVESVSEGGGVVCGKRDQRGPGQTGPTAQTAAAAVATSTQQQQVTQLR